MAGRRGLDNALLFGQGGAGRIDPMAGMESRREQIITPFARSAAMDLGPGRYPVIDVAGGGREGGGRRTEDRGPMGAGGGRRTEGGEMELVTPNAQRSTLNGESAPMIDAAGGGGRRTEGGGPMGSGTVIDVVGRRPVVEGTIMRRGAAGSGEYGEKSDLSPVRVTRMNPMSVEEGVRKGLIVMSDPGAAQRAADRVTQNQMDAMPLVNAMRAQRDKSQEMVSPAARAMRERMDNRTAAAGPVSATGRNPSQGKLMEMGKAGFAYDRATGQWNNLQAEEIRRRSEVGLAGAAVDAERNRTQAEIERGKLANDTRRVAAEERNAGPKGLDRLNTDDVLAGLAKYGKPKPMSSDDLRRADPQRWAEWVAEKDTARKAAMLEAPWTEDNQRAYAPYAEEARRRGLVRDGKTEDGRRRTEDGTKAGTRNWRELMK